MDDRVAAHSQRGLERSAPFVWEAPSVSHRTGPGDRLHIFPIAPPTGRTGGSLQSTLGCQQHTDVPSQHSDPLLRAVCEAGSPTSGAR